MTWPQTVLGTETEEYGVYQTAAHIWAQMGCEAMEIHFQRKQYHRRHEEKNPALYRERKFREE